MTRIRLEYVHEYRSRERTYYYFRRRGFKKVRLPGRPGSDEFMVAYQQALSCSEPNPIGANRTKPGTVNACIVGYYTCLAFRGLASSTQQHRRAILERFREKHGDKRIGLLPSHFIERMLNQMPPVAARNWLKALRGLLEFAVKEKFCATNPARDIRLPKWKGGHHRAWTDAEVEQYERIHAIGSKARLACALGIYTIQRAGDIRCLGQQHVRNGELTFKQSKTGVRLTLPIVQELKTVLDATPSGHMTFLVNDSGGQYSGARFSDQFRQWSNQAGLPRECTFHGLRVTGCTRLADAGYSVHQIAAWSGHMTLKEVERYTKGANQKRLAQSAAEGLRRTKVEQASG
jgi:integrase